MDDKGHLLIETIDWARVDTERERLVAEKDRLDDRIRKISDRLDDTLELGGALGPPLLIQILHVVSEPEKLKVLAKALSAAADTEKKRVELTSKIGTLSHAVSDKDWFVRNFLDSDTIRDASVQSAGGGMVAEIEGFLALSHKTD